jgi:hypothetical protein
MNQKLLLFVTANFLSMSLHAAPIVFQSPASRVSLVELYTSEGCSSCPPADRWMSQLKDLPGLWKEFVPVAFHVDYWDNLGWTDPWANPEFSERQRAHAAAWKTDSIYTPEVVLNGKEWRSWRSSDSKSLAENSAAGILTLRSPDTNRWEVTFVSSSAKSSKTFHVHAALLGTGLRSQVKAGENSGVELRHDFVALNLIEAPLKPDGTFLRGEFLLPRLDPRVKSGRFAFAAWITSSDSPSPLQSTGGWLE